MKPKSTLEGSFPSHNSASLSEAERRIKALEDENLTLRRDLADISSLYNVLIKDEDKEKFDERRINLLKSQLIQLERQVLMLTESLSCRANMLLEVENGLQDIADVCRNHLSEDRGAVTVPRDSLKNIEATAESCRIKLAKNIENSSPDNYTGPLLMMDKFVKQKSGQPVSLYDVCSGSTEHLNLKHVGKLESRLAQVFKGLTSLSHTIELSTGDVSHNTSSRLSDQVSHATEIIQKASADLLELSILIPSAPWPGIQKPVFKDITAEDILASLPNFPKSRSQEGQEKVSALVKAFNYLIVMKDMEIKCTERDLQYFKAVHECQQNYIYSLLESMKTAYTDFESNTNEILCKPLKEILNSYESLEQRQSESDLRKFLSSFKQYAPEITTAVNLLDTNRKEKGGVEALSTFGEQFFESIDKLQSDCILARELATRELDVVKREMEETTKELKVMFPQTSDQMYNQIVSGTEEMSISSSSNAYAANMSTTDMNSTLTPKARDRRRAAKVAAVSTLSPTVLPTLPVSGSLITRPTETFTEGSEDTSCTCGEEPDQTWEDSLRRYTPDMSSSGEQDSPSLPQNKPPSSMKFESPSDKGKKLLPSRLPKAQVKLGGTPPSGAVTKRSVTPKSMEKPRTPKSGTPQAKLVLKRRDNRSHSLDNSVQDLPLRSDSREQSPSMPRSSSLSQRPDWVT